MEMGFVSLGEQAAMQDQILGSIRSFRDTRIRHADWILVFCHLRTHSPWENLCTEQVEFI